MSRPTITAERNKSIEYAQLASVTEPPKEDLQDNGPAVEWPGYEVTARATPGADDAHAAVQNVRDRLKAGLVIIGNRVDSAGVAVKSPEAIRQEDTVGELCPTEDGG